MRQVFYLEMGWELLCLHILIKIIVMIGKILSILSGSIIAQFITFSVLPLLTRLYDPSDFGVLAAYSSIVGLLMAVSAMSYPSSLVIASKGLEVNIIIIISLAVSVLSSLFFFITAFFLKEFFLGYVGLADIRIIFFVPIAIFGAVLFQILRNILIRYQKFKLISYNLVFTTVLFSLIKVVGAFFSVKYLVLIVSFSVNYFIQALILLIRNKAFFKCFFNMAGVTLTETKAVFFKYIDFPKYRTPKTLTYLLGESLPIFFITKKYGVEVAGYYSLARLTLGAPISLIGQSVVDVVYSTVASKRDNALSILKRLYFFYAPIIITGALFLLFFSNDVFVFVFGDEWGPAGESSSVLSYWLLAFLLVRPLYACIPVYEMQKQEFHFEVFSFLVKLVLFCFAFYFDFIYIDMVFLYSIGCFFLDILFGWYLLLKYKERSYV